jgi:hypothetical protein
MRMAGWRQRVLLVGVVLGGGLLVGPLAGAAPVLGVGTVPPCTIHDVPANPGGYDDWATTLVDWTFTVGPDYKPPDLVSVRKGGIGGSGLVRQVVIDGLNALAAAAKAHGTPLAAWSAYRSYKLQESMFNDGVSAYGYDASTTYWGRPGHSEHQLGLAIDFIAIGDSGISSGFESTRAGSWMAKNAWKYGWLMSYPKGKQDLVCLHYEPWHYRYFGVDLAKKIHDSGLTPREYLWTHFTQFNTDLSPLATASPSGTLDGSATPAATELIEPSAGIAATPGLAGSPSPTAPPTANTRAGGVEPMVAFELVLIALAAVALIASLRFFGRRRRR